MANKPSSHRSLMSRIPGLGGTPNRALKVSSTASGTGQLLTPERTSVVSEGVHIRGDIASPGTVHINGAFEGNIRADKIVIGRYGVVTGQCRAQSVSIAGELAGEVTCDDLRIFEKGVVTGTIQCERMEVSAGGQIDAATQASHLEDQPNTPLISGRAAG